ncbi:similar to Saccharomyces cerevisiae YJL172W CPS1 Vacuolar carboxypeptidase yscS [Maudiozyma barnettii]|uniref:Similar to Saccharomyces cerevisiae YJL172W CPS1 Vacuolar carboxypeptidase yscS n=1 Tax=Maudiozyma barnettii TaxID=61262 RepID=A0A8H2VAJ7_9SACH|nr:uncharacterized protein KABA2_01S00176 [Kazachstania barnettii]CAB4251848.1 similar to Saccharomyces cerevisiae YJL172W CPS1 Vacuolar carboxypeptidase yscS [Kazachstania barnettii]CAD1778117.1 similar to Saccharomyces cerevisiae YJL172W CPS1 Vacuolar carboxypeptidase yscS [Kazachstania barnettii]
MSKIPTNANSIGKKFRTSLLLCLATILLVLFTKEITIWTPFTESIKEEYCPARFPLHASDDLSVQNILHDPEYKQLSIKRLAGAIQIPTVIHDDNPQPKYSPEYYKEWYTFHEYLAEQFPLVHKYLKKETVNNASLLYTWQGSNPDLKPIIFSAHIDVVPVESSTVQQWEHPPFSGHYDEESDTIWGRGSFDAKNLLIAQFEAIEHLLSSGKFTTKRTILLSYGHDEETGGAQGANSISKLLLNRYGPKGILALFDEGAGVIPLKDNKTFVAAILNSEKGYVDLAIKLSGTGPGRTGHSSQPPDHTHIGVAADLISLLEKHSFKSNFKVTNPTFEFLTCAAEHSLGLPRYLQWLISSARHNRLAEYALGRLLDAQESFKYYFKTSQAIDIIQGGNKANALPEYVTFTINHRIEIESSVNETISHFISLAKIIASKYHYSIFLDGKTVINEHPQKELAPASIDIQPIGLLEPSPITPAEGDLWDILTGTVQYIFEDSMGKTSASNLFMAPALSPGNTDSKHFWDVTDHIYRFIGSIVPSDILDTTHSVNEHFVMNHHLQTIAFVHQFILNINTFGPDL